MNEIGVVFSAEFMRRIRSRPFLVGLIIGVVVLVVMTRLPSMLDRLTNESAKRIVVVAGSDVLARAGSLLRSDYTVAASLSKGAPDAAMLRAYKASSIVEIRTRGESLVVTVFAKDPSNVSERTIRRDLLPLQLQRMTNLPARDISRALGIPVRVRAIASKFGSSTEEEAAHAIAFSLVFFLYLTILLNSQLILSSVAEEKTSRIAELLIASIDPSTLLVGKIAAGTVLACLQLAVWIGADVLMGGTGGAASSSASSSSSMVTGVDLSGILAGNLISPLTVIAFVGFFLLGLLQLSTLCAGVASMITRTEDIGSLSAPVIFPVVIALFLAIAAIDAPDASWAVASSFVPLVSPFVMFARIAVADVPIWQIALSFGVNLAALAAIAWGVGRIYRVGMLFYGRAPSLGQVWKALRST